MILSLFISLVKILFPQLYKKNNSYYLLLKKFKTKLPPNDKKAKELTKDEKNNSDFIPDELKGFRTFDASKHNTSIQQHDIDVFFNELENFNYNFMFFHKEYKKFTYNLYRFKDASNKSGDFKLIQLQNILDDYLEDIEFYNLFKSKCLTIIRKIERYLKMCVKNKIF